MRRFDASATLLAALWIASEATMLAIDPQMGYAGLGFIVYLAVMSIITYRVVPAPPANDDVLVATGTPVRLIARCAVVALAVVVVAVRGLVLVGVVRLPMFSQVYSGIESLAPWLGSGLPNFVMEALVPGLIVVALGATARQLGLTRPARGTLLATTIWIGLFVAAWIWRGAMGRLGIAALAVFLLHNLLSNGFTEEFFTRGLVFSHLRAGLSTGWALAAQAVIFALLHLPGSLHDERTFLGDVANVIALNVPLGYAMGLMALRTRSLALPTTVHVALDTLRNVFS